MRGCWAGWHFVPPLFSCRSVQTGSVPYRHIAPKARREGSHSRTPDARHEGSGSERRRRAEKVARGQCERSEHAAPGSPKRANQAWRADRKCDGRVSVAPPGLTRSFKMIQGLRARFRSHWPLATFLPRLRRSVVGSRPYCSITSPYSFLTFISPCSFFTDAFSAVSTADFTPSYELSETRFPLTYNDGVPFTPSFCPSIRSR